MTYMAQIGRWVAVFPGALVTALLVTFPVHWIVMLIHSNPEHTLSGIPVRRLEYAGYAFFLPLTFVLVGANIAPFYKFKTGIVLACLWLLFVVGSVVLSVRSGGQILWWTVPMSGALALTALILAVVKVRRDENNNAQIDNSVAG
jgi:hypothetical protein